MRSAFKTVILIKFAIVGAMLIAWACALPLSASAQSRKVDSLIAALRLAQSDSTRVACLYAIAEAYQRLLPDSALLYARETETLARRIGKPRFAIQALSVQANIARDRGLYADAILTYKRALALCDSANRLEEKAKALNNLAIVYSRQGNYAQALEHYFQSLKIKEEIGDSLGIANAMANTGLVYKKQAQYADALKMYAQALQRFRELNDDVGIAAMLNNIGAVYRLQKNLDSARVYYEASLEAERRIGKKAGLDNPPDVATALVNLADVYAEQNQLALARKSAEEARKLFEVIGDQSGLITATRTLGVIAGKEGKTKEALSHLNRSVEIGQAIAEPEELRESYLALSELHAKRGDFENALAAYKNYHALYDTLLNLEKAKTVNSLKTQFETERKEKEIALLQQEKEIQSLALSRETLLRNSFIGISILAFALALTAFRAFRIKQKSEQMLQEKNRALDDALKIAEEQRKVADTQREVAEEQRKVAEGQRHIAEEANRVKTELLAIAAHDLKNPLQSISGFAELAKEKLATLSPERSSALPNEISVIESFLEKIYSSSQRMAELIKSLLETAALEAGKIALNASDTNVSALVTMIVSDFEAPAQRKRQRLETDIEPNCQARIDAARMREVIENLVSNAIKYSPEGKTIWVSCKKRETKSEISETSGAQSVAPLARATILIAVRDEGQGLTKEDKAKLFGKFQRLSARPTGGESSTGLGLSIVKKIVEMHGGKVWAESDGKDKGATFFVELPASAVAQD